LVSLPIPTPGLVIRYNYLWHSEFLAGRDEGIKDRPCSVIATVRSGDDGDVRVLVLTVTHAVPSAGTPAIEIPLSIKTTLGLDSDRSWIVLSEWNEFVWPRPDLRPIPHDQDGDVAYGVLSRGFFARVRDEFVATVKAGRAKRVRRTE
jgi:hypothetical protein